MKQVEDLMMIACCPSCGELQELGHQYWCACTCQTCGGKIHNWLHNCEGKRTCNWEP